MIVQPRVRGFICTTAHPVGCAQHVQQQIDYVKNQSPITDGPKKALIIGASTGYGLASRIVVAFACRAATLGVFFEKEAENKRTATSGWYNSVAFEKAARKEGLFSRSFNGDAFSEEIKQKVISSIKKELGTIDLVVYSLASPRRIHPITGKVSKAVLKPIGKEYTNKTIDFETNQVVMMTLNQATPEDIEQTVSVMGGEDWEMWIEALEGANVLSNSILTCAYSYIGPDVTRTVYRHGTIGAAKDHLEKTAQKLNEKLKKRQGRALISVNKALVTQSSSAIPFIPLYFIILMKVMKQKGVHEDCIQQMYRLYANRLYAGKPVPTDEQGRVRIDDIEMRPDIQAEVQGIWEKINNENLRQLADLAGYEKNFLRLFGFDLEGVDYNKEVDINLSLP